MLKLSSIPKLWIFVFLFILLTGCSGSKPLEFEDVEDSKFKEGKQLEGELIHIDESKLRIRQDDGQEFDLILSNQTTYWDGIDWMMKTPAKVGDRIEAFGVLAEDTKTFSVDRYYANRVDLQGIVYYVCGETEAFMVDQPDQEYIIIPLPQKTELRTETPTDPTSYKYFDLMPNFGEELQVVGREIDEPFLIAVVMTRMD